MIILWQIITSLKTYKRECLRLSYSFLFLSFLCCCFTCRCLKFPYSLQSGRQEQAIWTQEDHFHNSSELPELVTAIAAGKDCQGEDQHFAFIIELWYTEYQWSVPFSVFSHLLPSLFLSIAA